MSKQKKNRSIKKPAVKKELRWEDAFKKINKVCVTTIIVLIYLLAIFAGLNQELTCYVMELNVNTSKTADSIITDEAERAKEVFEGVEHFYVSAPKGTGNYVALFGGEEIWVVDEMSTAESLKVIALFTMLDICTYAITILIIARHFNDPKYKKWVAVLAGYQIVFLMFAWVVHSYSWSVLFNNTIVSPLQTLVRIIGLCVAIVMFNKSRSVRLKNRRLK